MFKGININSASPSIKSMHWTVRKSEPIKCSRLRLGCSTWNFLHPVGGVGRNVSSWTNVFGPLKQNLFFFGLFYLDHFESWNCLSPTFLRTCCVMMCGKRKMMIKNKKVWIVFVIYVGLGLQWQQKMTLAALLTSYHVSCLWSDRDKW